jgi:hypothetical protein
MKTYKTTDPKTGKEVTLIRVETKCKCLGCFFLDEEIGDCMAPMPIELGGDCMDDLETGETKHFQFIEKP